MDPKMDTGMIVDDYATRPQYDVNQSISPRNLIWIFDNILVGQMTWLSGHALSQTLFTSCYILRAMEIKDDQDCTTTSPEQPPIGFTNVVLKVCVIAIAKTCALIWEEMRKGQVYEEEDFMTNKFGVSMYENLPLSSVVAMLDQAEHWMDRTGTQWIKAHEGEDASAVVSAVKDRIIHARVSLLVMYQVLSPKCTQFQNAIPQLQVARECTKRLQASNSLGVEITDAFDHSIHRKLVTNTPPRAIALLTLSEVGDPGGSITFEQLDRMCEDLISIGHALEFTDPITLMNFFVQFGAQKPSPGAFPRSVLQTVLYDDKIIMGSRPLTEVVIETIRETVHPLPWIFGQDSDVQVPGQLPTIQESPEAEGVTAAKRHFQLMFADFVDKATKPFVDTLQIMGQNVARQRRNLRKIVQLWETLQEQAEMLDEGLHMILTQIHELEKAESAGDEESEEQQEEAPQPFYFVSWSYHMKLWVMEWMLLLGSELELYSPFEFSMIYGYCDIIVGAHARHLHRVQSVIDGEMEQERKKNQDKANAAKKKKKKKKKKPTATPSPGVESPSSTAPTTPVISEPTFITPTVEQQREATHVVRIQQQLVSARLNLARGTFLVLAALTKTGYLSTTPAHLASHGLNDLETLYKQRFKAFHHLSSPELLSFPAYLERLECDRLDSIDILDYAAEFFNEAKKSLDDLQTLSAAEARVTLCEDAWRKDLKNMIRVCIGNKVGIAALKKDARVVELRRLRDEYFVQVQRAQQVHKLKMLQRKLQGSKGKKTTASSSGESSGSSHVLEQEQEELLRPVLPPPEQMPSPTELFKSPRKNVVFDWKYHHWWPVIGLQETKH
ncbi:hypothetical protein BG003_009819 [Podila horticola]|nr:hypothetical protein BG003_009819 [Podila horticola]